jgi:biotin operon repressor
MKLKDLTNDLPSQEEVILNYLRKQHLPVSKQSVVEKFSLSSWKVSDIIASLRGHGYDIKSIIMGREEFYSLVRYGKLSTEDYYKRLGKVNTPMLITGDWHIGSKSSSKLAFKALLKDIDEFGVKDLLICGDLLQGLGVYSMEREDLSLFSIDEQVEETVEMLKQVPSRTKIHMVMGGHEQKIKAEYKAGFDSLAAIARQLKNASYYGYTANLTLNKEFNLLALHGKGGSAYASSYSLEKVWRNLTERPHVLAIGHFHELNVVHKPPNYVLLKVGTLQRETIYIMSMGISAQVGWIILDDYSYERANPLIRCPRVY